MRRAMVSLVSVVLVAGIVWGCGGDGLAGDWFPCEDAACSTLDDDGVRFTEDGRWYLLDAPGGSLDAGESYRVAGGPGTYDFDGSTLTLTLTEPGKSAPVTMTVPARLEGDELVMEALKSSSSFCASPQAGPTTCVPSEGKPQDLRFRRVGFDDGTTVDPVPWPQDDDRPIPPPPPAPAGDQPTPSR